MGQRPQKTQNDDDCSSFIAIIIVLSNFKIISDDGSDALHCGGWLGYKYNNNPDDDTDDADDAFEVVVGCDTIQFHEQSWASHDDADDAFEVVVS